MKKAVRIVLSSLLVLVVALAAIVAIGWNRELASVATVKQVDEEGYLFEMEYKAGYDLDKLIAADIDRNGKLLEYVVGELSHGLVKKGVKRNESPFGCSSFQAKNAEGEGYLFGRNYDLFKTPTLVLHSHPDGGYASITVCDMSHLGYSMEKLPDSFASRLLCLAAVYAPMDGMNEKGLCASILALPNMCVQQNTGKHVLGTTILVRAILDRCATVQEALDFIAEHDVRFDAGSSYGFHYLIADASGDCAVLEFDRKDNWNTLVVRKPEDANYLHVTNHLLSPAYYSATPNPEFGNPASKSWWRYDTIKAFMDERGGVVTADDAQECLSLVHWKDLPMEDGRLENTVYSNVFDQSALTLVMHPWEDYDTAYRFKL